MVSTPLFPPSRPPGGGGPTPPLSMPSPYMYESSKVVSSTVYLEPAGDMVYGHAPNGASLPMSQQRELHLEDKIKTRIGHAFSRISNQKGKVLWEATDIPTNDPALADSNARIYNKTHYKLQLIIPQGFENKMEEVVNVAYLIRVARESKDFGGLRTLVQKLREGEGISVWKNLIHFGEERERVRRLFMASPPGPGSHAIVDFLGGPDEAKWTGLTAAQQKLVINLATNWSKEEVYNNRWDGYRQHLSWLCDLEDVDDDKIRDIQASAKYRQLDSMLTKARNESHRMSYDECQTVLRVFEGQTLGGKERALLMVGPSELMGIKVQVSLRMLELSEKGSDETGESPERRLKVSWRYRPFYAYMRKFLVHTLWRGAVSYAVLSLGVAMGLSGGWLVGLSAVAIYWSLGKGHLYGMEELKLATRRRIVDPLGYAKDERTPHMALAYVLRYVEEQLQGKKTVQLQNGELVRISSREARLITTGENLFSRSDITKELITGGKVRRPREALLLKRRVRTLNDTDYADLCAAEVSTRVITPGMTIAQQNEALARMSVEERFKRDGILEDIIREDQLSVLDVLQDRVAVRDAAGNLARGPDGSPQYINRFAGFLDRSLLYTTYHCRNDKFDGKAPAQIFASGVPVLGGSDKRETNIGVDLESLNNQLQEAIRLCLNYDKAFGGPALVELENQIRNAIKGTIADGSIYATDYAEKLWLVNHRRWVQFGELALKPFLGGVPDAKDVEDKDTPENPG